MAHLQRQGSQWTIRFSFEGKRRRITVGPDKRSAQRVLRKLEGRLVELDLGLHSLKDQSLFDYLTGVEVKTITLGDAIANYIKHCRLATTTIRNYRIHHTHLTSFFGEEIALNDLNVESYVQQRRKVVSDSTIKKELISLNNLYRSSGVKGKEFPSLLINKKREFSNLAKSNDGRRVLLSKEEIEELREVVRAKGSELIADCVDVIAFTGIRRSEFCRLTPDDVDLESRTLLITEKKRVHGQLTFRKLPIHAEIFPLIKRRLEHSPFFTTSANTLTAGLRKAIRGSKFEKCGFGFHVLRHSAASRLLAQGIPVTAVAAIMGHATPQTTLHIYSHAFEEDIEKGVNLL